MKMAHIFFDTHMACGHAALGDMLKGKKIKHGDCAVFVNTAFTAVKILVDGVFIAHYRHPSGRIAPETLKHLPNYLDGSDINYTGALKEVIDEYFVTKKGG